MSPSSFAPGVVPFYDTLPALVIFPDADGPLVPLGLTVDGSIAFSQAGTTAGDPVEATSSGVIIGWVPVEAP